MARGILTASTLALAAATANGLTATRSWDGGSNFTFTITDGTAPGSYYMAVPDCPNANYTGLECAERDDILGRVNACKTTGNSYTIDANTRTVEVIWWDDTGNSGSIEAPGCDAVAPLVCQSQTINIDSSIDCNNDLVHLALSATDCTGYNSVKWTSDGGKTSILSPTSVLTTATFPVSSFSTGILNETFSLVLTDENSVESSCKHTYTVNDNTPPQLHDTSPDAMDVACDDIPIPAVIKATDNCSASSDVIASSHFVTSGTLSSGTGHYVNTYTVSDERGNIVEKKKTVNVVDIVPPVLVGLPEINGSVECGQNPDPCAVTAVDNCAGNVAVHPSESTVTLSACAFNIIRTFTATDEDGRNTSVDTTVLVTDSTLPELVGKPSSDTQFVSCDVSDVTTVLPTISGSDACTGNISITPVADVNGNYLYSAQDACGLTSTYLHSVVVYDDSPPVISGVDGSKTVENIMLTNPLSLFCSPIATDNCDDTVQVNFTDEVANCNSNGCSCVYVRNFEAIDDDNNVTTAKQTITVVDTAPPTFFGTRTEPTMSFECDEVPVLDIKCEDLGVGGNNGFPSWDAKETVNGSVYEWECVDDCGLFVKKTTDLTIYDNTPPQFFNVQADFSADCSQMFNSGAVITSSADLLELIPAPSVVENCGSANLQKSATSTFTSTSDCRGNACQVKATYIATDDASLSNTVVIVLTITDSTPPVFDLPLPSTFAAINCDSTSINTEMAITLTATDNCSSLHAVVESTPVDVTTSKCDGEYTRQRTFTATDGSGNKTVFVRDLNVTDNVPPQFTSVLPTNRHDSTCHVTDGTWESLGLVMYTTDIESVTYSDDCSTSVDFNSDSSATSSFYSESIKTPATEGCNGKMTRNNLIRITDECGNFTEYTWVHTIDDTTDPVWTSALPSHNVFRDDQYNLCGSKNIFEDTVTSSDSCELVAPDAAELALNAGVVSEKTSDCNYNLTRSWKPIDSCGNDNTSHTVVYQIQDNVPPTINTGTVSATRTCDCDDNACITSGLSASNGVRWSDCCDTNLEGLSDYGEEVSRSCANTYEFTEIHSITDSSTFANGLGNTSTYTTKVSVSDQAPPSIDNVASNQSVECGADYTSLLSPVSFSDNCTPENTLQTDSSEKAGGSKLHGEETIYQYTNQDECGHSTTSTVTFNYLDTTPPVLSVTDHTVECNKDTPPNLSDVNILPNLCSDACNAYSGLGLPSISHNVDSTHTSLDQVTDGYVTKSIITYTCTDDVGHKHVETATLKVVDNTDPSFSDPAPPLTYECNGILNIPLNYSDDCDVNPYYNMKETEISRDSDFEYLITRTHTVTDESGHFDEVVQNVTINDVTPPTLKVVSNDNHYQCEYVSFQDTAGSVEAQDNCSAVNSLSVVLTEAKQNDVCDHDHEYVRTWSVIDQAGNAFSVVRTVVIKNDTKPTLGVEPLSDSKQWQEWLSHQDPAFTGLSACGSGLTVTVDADSKNFTSGVGPFTGQDCPTTYVNNRRISVKDTCNLETEHKWTETATDNSPPTLDFSVNGVPVDSSLGGAKLLWEVEKECNHFANSFETLNYSMNSADGQHSHFPGSIHTGLGTTLTPPGATITDDCKSIVNVYTVSDCAGNTAVYMYSEEIDDNTNPTLTWIDNNGDSTSQPVSATYECSYEVPNKDIGVQAIFNDICTTPSEVTPNNSYNNSQTDKDIYTNTWTYSYRDSCYNPVSHAYSIVVHDQTAPEYYWGAAENDVEPADTTAEASLLPDTVVCNWGDNCYAEDQSARNPCSLKTTTNSQLTSSDYTLRHCYSHPDQNGQNAGVPCYDVVVTDNIPPVMINLPLQNISVEGTHDWPIAVPNVTCTDEMSPAGTPVASNRPVAYDQDEIWHHELPEIRQFNITRTWECEDISGNTDIFVQTIEVLDKVASEFECVPIGTDVECDDNFTQGKIDAASQLHTNDTKAECDWTPIDAALTIASLVISTQSQKCEDDYTLVYSYTAYDVVGNQNAQDQTISVQDNAAPVFDAASLTAINAYMATADVNGIFDWCEYVGGFDMKAVDACNNRDVTVVRTDTYSYPVTGHSTHPELGGSNYNVKHTYTTEDLCGNENTHSYNAVIRDKTNPSISCSDSRGTEFCNTTHEVECTGSTPPHGPDSYSADNGSYGLCVAQDQNTNYVSINTTPSNIASTSPDSSSFAGCGDLSHSYEYKVRATDNSGNFDENTHTYYYTDRTPPTLVGPNTALPEFGPDFHPSRNGDHVTLFSNAYDCSDDCSSCVVHFNQNAVYETNTSVDGGYQYVSEWRVQWVPTDVCNLTASHSDVYYIQPNTVFPQFDTSQVQDYTVEANTANMCGTFDGVDYGRCLGLDNKIYCNTVTNLCTDDALSGDLSTVLTLTVTDDSFHESQTKTISYDPSWLKESSDCETKYVKTWSVSDNTNNISTHSQTITVRDTTPPVFTSTPGPYDHQCHEHALIDSILMQNLSAYDVGSSDPVVVTNSASEVSFCGYNEYSDTLKYVAEDKCGLKTTHTTQLSVTDIAPPTIQWTFDEVYVTQCKAVDPVDICDVANLQLLDNCGQQDFKCADPSYSDYQENTLNYADANRYTIERIWTFYDAVKSESCANSVQKNIHYTVNDNIGPQCVIEDYTKECSDDLPAPETINCFDNCEQSPGSYQVQAQAISTSLVQQTGSNYDIIRTWWATDLSSNTNTYHQTIHFMDTTPPVINLDNTNCNDLVSPRPDLNAVNTVYGACGWGYADSLYHNQILTNLSDNCASNDYLVANANSQRTITVDSDETCLFRTVAERSFEVTDANGKISVATVTAIAVDDTLPVFTTHNDLSGPTVGTAGEIDTVNRVITEGTGSLNVVVAAESTGISNTGTYIEETTTYQICATNAADYLNYFFYDSGSHICLIPTMVDTQAEVAGTYTKYNITSGSDGDQVRRSVDLLPGVHKATDHCSIWYYGNPGSVSVQVSVVDIHTDECSSEKEYTYFAYDVCGNESYLKETKSAQDAENPKLVNVPDNVSDNECTTIDDQVIQDSYIVSATDNSTTAVVISKSKSERNFSCGSNENNGTFEVEYTWRATDACGLFDESKRTFTHTDNTPPILNISTIPNYSMECSDSFDYHQINASDNCSGIANNSYTAGHGEAHKFSSVTYYNDNGEHKTLHGSNNMVDAQINVGKTEFTMYSYFEAADACGKLSWHSQQIYVSDETPPLLLNIPANHIVQCTSDDTSAPPTSSDNCEMNGSVKKSTAFSNQLKPHQEVRVHTYSVTDKAGNITTTKQTVTIYDNTPPSFTDFISEGTNDCNNIQDHPIAQYTDNCSGTVKYSAVKSDAIPVDGCLDNYTETTEYTITDVSGNRTVRTFTLTIEDNDSPTFNVTPIDASVDISLISDTWPGEITASDTCDNSVNVNFVETIVGEPRCTHDFSLKRVWSAQDCASNPNSVVQFVTVTDNIPPVITATQVSNAVTTVDSMDWNTSITVYDIIDSYGFEISDNSGEDIITQHIVHVQKNGNLAGKSGCYEEHVVTFSATDDCSNKSEHIFTVDIVDLTPPEFNDYPAHLTIEIDETIPTCNVQVINDCASVTVKSSQTTSNGKIIRTWIATDNNSQTTSYDQTITVSDTSPPRLTHRPIDGTAECDCTANLNTFSNLSAVDNDSNNSSPTVTHTQTINNAPSGNNYEIVHEWGAIDAANNSVAHKQTIQVSDNFDPVLIDLDNDDNNGQLPAILLSTDCAVFIPDLNIGARDACDPNVTVTPTIQNSLNGSDCKTYSITRTFVASDADDHKATFTQVVEVSDVTHPTCDGCSTEMCLFPNGKGISLSLSTLFGDLVTDDCSSNIGFANVRCLDNGTGSCSYNSGDQTFSATGVEGAIYTLLVDATDSCNNPITFSRTIVVDDIATTLTKSCMEPNL